MATIRQRKTGSWEMRISRKSLAKPIYLTFDTEGEARREASRIERLLDQGIIPEEYLEGTTAFSTISDAIRMYRDIVSLSSSSAKLLDVLETRIGKTRVAAVDYRWAEGWIADMKRKQFLKPTTIKHYVGELSRCLTWLSNRYPNLFPDNPLLRLPTRYAAYSAKDQESARESVGKAIFDQERFRRLEPSEETRIRAILSGQKPEGRQRAFQLPHREALLCLFDVALESAMRLREIYTLRIDQVSFAKRTIVVEKSKNGRARQVLMSSVCESALRDYIGERQGGLVFPWWSGVEEENDLNKTTYRLSRQFGRIFNAAKCDDLHFHDLRHEAISRLYERTTIDSSVIKQFVGHISEKAHKRYMNLRPAAFADRMW